MQASLERSSVLRQFARGLPDAADARVSKSICNARSVTI